MYLATQVYKLQPCGLIWGEWAYLETIGSGTHYTSGSLKIMLVCVYGHVHWLLLIYVFYFLHMLKVVVRWYPWMDAARVINCLQVSGSCLEVVQILVPCPQVAEIRWWWDQLVTSKQFSPRRWKYWLLKSTETLGFMAPPTKALWPDLHWLPAGQCRWWKVAWENGSFDLPGSQGILGDWVCFHTGRQLTMCGAPPPFPWLQDFSGVGGWTTKGLSHSS